jgi:pimeloyl-ACP methyl ester carboxylesterase
LQKDGGMLESVEQRAKLPIRKLDVEGRTIGLDVGVASFEGTLDSSGRQIAGTFKQGAVELPLTFQRVERPQTPLRPFPYAEEEIGYAGAAGVKLAGTLTYPKSRGPFPAAFVVLMAGGGASGDRVLLQQDFDSARASGVPEAKIKQDLDMEAKLYEVVRREKDTASAEKRMRELLGSAPGAEQRIRAILSPTLRDLIAYDPGPVLRALACPVLAITGSKDVQASARLNLPAISAALAEGATANWAVVELPGLNHLFQTAGTGAVGEYARIEETIAPVALDAIGNWLSRNILRN